MDKMHLKRVEETEWDAAGELGNVIQAAQNMRILYFNALAKKKSDTPLQSKSTQWQQECKLLQGIGGHFCYSGN